jgi:hypothetical protein
MKHLVDILHFHRWNISKSDQFMFFPCTGIKFDWQVDQLKKDHRTEKRAA